ncbi:hypothetical protein [Eggerthella lenta]|nr:hypothetical protein [Eggerthella lenta]
MELSSVIVVSTSGVSDSVLPSSKLALFLSLSDPSALTCIV